MQKTLRIIRFGMTGIFMLAGIALLSTCDLFGALTKTQSARVDAPTFSPAPGTYHADTSVTLSTATAGAAIHYTTDGSSPTSASAAYSSPIALVGSGTTAIKAIAIKSGMDDSELRSGTYTLDVPDTTPPTVSATNPATAATGVYAYAPISASFDEALAAGTVTTSSFTLEDASHVLVAGMVSCSAATVTFTPSSNLAFNTAYTATLTPAITDLAGNAMSAYYSWSFTTGSAPGSLDTSFGGLGTGYDWTAIGTVNDYVYAAALQSDDKIVVAGKSYDVINSTNDFAVVRYLADGTLDSGFGSGGKVTTDINNYHDDWGLATAIQADGKILVAGMTNNGTNWDIALVRYDTNGAVDPGFGLSGKVATAIGSGDDVANAITVQADGKIVVAGTSMYGSYRAFALARYITSGALDTGFGVGGKMTTAFGGTADAFGNAVAIQADGKILVAGTWSGTYAIARYNTNGLLDSTFGTGGTVTSYSAPVGSSYSALFSIAVQTDGKILVGGNGGLVYNNGYMFASRLNTDGSLDAGFGSLGIAAIGAGYNNSGLNRVIVLVQGDGRIILAGDLADSWSTNCAAVARINANGLIDTTFGSVLAANGSHGVAAVIQSSGKIVIAGSNWGTNDSSVVHVFGIMRFVP